MAKRNPKQIKPSELSVILRTNDPEEQVKVVNQIIQLANAPVLSMLINVDTRLGSVDWRFIGPDETPFEMLYKMLDGARQAIMRMEMEQKKQQEDAQKAQAALSPEAGEIPSVEPVALPASES